MIGRSEVPSIGHAAPAPRSLHGTATPLLDNQFGVAVAPASRQLVVRTDS